MDQRQAQLEAWLNGALGMRPIALQPVSSDASFRRYFRVRRGAERWIAMDAPPDREACRPFVEIARRLRALGLNVPEVAAADLEQGFLLLSDLGERRYLDVLNDANADALYGDALDALVVVQTRGPRAGELPPYDRDLLRAEMELFRRWHVERHLGLSLDADARRLFDETMERLIANALEQPQVCVHRDYHARNLMAAEGADNPGILDFQDAVIGPLTYDPVSLLRDCYIAWPRRRVERWALAYRDRAVAAGAQPVDDARFLRWFDLMGVQRHLKAVGIFARLWRRDGKRDYLRDIPRTLGYIAEVCARRPALAPLGALIARIDRSYG